MKKRLLCILLAVMILTTLVACGGNGSSAGTSSSAASQTEGTSTTGNGNKPVQIVMAFPTFTGAPQDLAKVESAMNEISKTKIGVVAKLLVTDYASYNQQMTLMLSGNEPLDIFSTLGGLYMKAIQNGQAVNLEENDLLNKYGQGITKEVGKEYIDACRVGGVLYGLPNNRDMAQGRGCAAVRTDLLTEVGYKFKNQGEIEHITIDELNDIYAKIHKAHPELEIYRPTTLSMSQFSNVDLLGGDSFGVLMDYGAKLNVTNLFESDFYRQYCSRMYDYFKKGYISKDAATDTTAVTALVKAGTLASYTTGGKPGIKAQETNLCGKDMTILQTLDDYVSSNAVALFPWAVANNSKEREAAMKYLNLLYTDADMMNLISWGIEGVHYKVLSDGLIDYADGVDAKTSGYSINMGWMFFNQYLTHVWKGNDPKVWENIKAFNKDAKKSAAMGFTFDAVNVATAVTSVQNAYNEYQKSLEYGMVDPAKGIPEMNSKLKAAGIETIIKEKQTQLDKWAAGANKK